MASFLRGNLVWILLSLLLSTALWVMVTFQQNPEETQTLANVPVEFASTPSPTLSIEKVTTSVQLTVSAPRDVWPQLSPDTFKVTVDVSKIQPGVQSLTPKVTSTDPRARVEAVTPDVVQLRVEPLETKQVPVQVLTPGKVPIGYTAGTPKTTPSEVTVSGPRSSVDQVQTVVVTVPLEGVTKTIDETASPIPETTGGTPVDRITVSPEVLVEVPIEQTLTYKVVPVAPTITGQVAVGYVLVSFPSDPETVNLVGDPTVLGQLQAAPTQPISVDGLSADRDVTTTLALPGTVALAQQQTIVVHLHVQEINGSEIIPVSPRPANANLQYSYTFTPASVNVTISGPVSTLRQLQPDDIQVIVDVKDMKPGTTETVAPLIGGMPPDVKLVNAQPPTVTVAVR